MAINATTGAAASTQTAPVTTPDSTAGSNKTDNVKLSGNAAVAESNKQLNASILQSALTVSLSTQNDPMTLVYKTAIQNLNEVLKPTLGDNAIQNAAKEDNSPEATAGRIVSLTTGLFDLYKQSFPGEDESAVLDRFQKVIQGGITTGFNEARGILQGMNVLGGTISSNIDKTYDLVTKGLADFAASTKAQIAAAAAVTSQATAAGDTTASADATNNTANKTTSKTAS